MQPRHIENAIAQVQNGGVIAYPTEGVWGLGCDPFDEAAVMRILELKKRPVDKGLILVAADVAQIAALLDRLTPEQRAMVLSTWPGPTTWLLPDPEQLVPAWIKGKFATVAVRVSAHPGVVRLCRAFGGPLVSTSANPADAPPATSRVRVLTWFGGRLDYVVPGRLGGQRGPSTIRDLYSAAPVRA
ncbi:MAG: L-threonylcarbamoyladenylate synthase [Gammaproteobacteria bacterium]